MATVDGFTKERMLEIENTTVVDGNVVGDDLILLTREGTPINAGSVRGPEGDQGIQGIQGDTGLAGITRVNYGTTPGTARPAGAAIVLWVGSSSVSLPTNADTAVDLIAFTS